MAGRRGRNTSTSTNTNAMTGSNNNNKSTNNAKSGGAAKRSSSAPAPVRVGGGLCSRFLCEIKPGAKAYRYDVSISLQYDVYPPTELTGRISGLRPKRTLAREMNRSIFRIFKQKFQIKVATVYDNCNTLYCASELQLDRVGKITRLKQQHFIMASEVDDFIRENAGKNFLRVLVTIVPNAVAPELCLKVVKPSPNDVQDPNMPLRTFLELATSEWAVENGQYTSLPGGRLFSNNVKRFTDAGEGIVIRPGLRKGVTIVENDGHPTPCVDIEVKSSAFYKPQILIETAKSIHSNPNSDIHYADIMDIISEVAVQPIYNKKKILAVGDFTRDAIGRIPLDGEAPGGKTIVQYFSETYGITIRNTNWRGIIPGRSRDNVFPIEVLQILPHQIVQKNNTTESLQQKVHAANNVKPAIRYMKMMEEANNIHLFDNANRALNEFGIYVRIDSNDINVEVYNKPDIKFKANTSAKVDPVTATWKSGLLQYVDAKMTIAPWGAYYPKSAAPLVEEFLRKLQAEARKKNMFMAEEKFMKKCAYDDSQPPDLFEHFKRMAACKVNFVLYMDSKKIPDSHGKLKLAEALYSVVSQQVTLETIQNIVEKGHRQTLENILAKANIKFMGLNYSIKTPNLSGDAAKSLQLSEGGVLVFGMDVAHPKQLNLSERRLLRAKGLDNMSSFSIHPSVVGLCGNITSNPEAFTGGYFYQGSRCEQVDPDELREYVLSMLKALQKNRPAKSRPPTVIILRDGLSEGQHDMATRIELEAFKTAFAKFDSKWTPNIALIVVTKRHLKRIYEKGQADSAENPQPFTLADEKFSRYGTNAMLGENFAIAHKAIKGTAKPIQIDTIYNKTPFERDTLSKFAMSLAYSHQIVNLPTSLPQPIYQADALAGRGNDNYVSFRTYFPDQVPYKTVTFGTGKSERDVKVVDPALLNEKLSLRDKPLLEKRIT